VVRRCSLLVLCLQERATSPIANLFGGTRKVESLATQVIRKSFMTGSALQDSGRTRHRLSCT
jgi:hypothetical protein